MRDFFQILGVPRNAGAAAVRQATRRLSRGSHPDISEGADARRSSDAQLRDDAIARDHGRSDPPVDEIAIDFPSVAPLVERMRAAFFASRHETRGARWSAHIALTRGEARRGAEVPIDVPHRATCGACGGRGEIWMAGCDACGGLGSCPGAHRVRLVLPAGVAHGAQLVYRVPLPAGGPATLDVSVGVDEGRG